MWLDFAELLACLLQFRAQLGELALPCGDCRPTSLYDTCMSHRYPPEFLAASHFEALHAGAHNTGSRGAARGGVLLSHPLSMMDVIGDLPTKRAVCEQIGSHMELDRRLSIAQQRCTSPLDLWGRRWNLHVHAILKIGFYKPLVKVVPKAIASVATFVASALYHEIVFAVAFPSYTVGRSTLFFALIGCLVQVPSFGDPQQGDYKMDLYFRLTFLAGCLPCTLAFEYARPGPWP